MQRQETYDYNNRLQPVRLQVGTTSNSAANTCLVYNYYSGVANPTTCTATPQQASTGNNGNAMGYWYQDTVSPSFSQSPSYGYDALNRLSSAQSGTAWSQTYSYGRYGNMTCSGSGMCTVMTYNANNQISQVGTASVVYDAAGNVITDNSTMPATTYTWDAEGRLLTVTQGSTTVSSYLYNALGQMEQWTLYLYPTQPIQLQYTPAGQLVGMTQEAPAGGWYGLWSFFNLAGQRVASYHPSGYTSFHHLNALGTTVQFTDQTGAVIEDDSTYPWGQSWAETGGVGAFAYASTMNRDKYANLDWTPNRDYANRLGRWLTPDPAGRKAVTLTDPQTWNMYAYVRNNPTTLTDPSGLYELNPSNCGDNANCQKKYENAAKRFEARREKDLKSKKEDVRAAAASYGARGEANGVHLGFANLASQGIYGSVDPSGSMPGNPNVQVTLDFGRAGSAETQTHEGTHVADDLAFLDSYSRNTGTYDQNLSITHGQTEFDAFRAGAEVNHEHGFGPNETQKIWDYVRAHYGDVINDPVFNPNNFPTGPND